MKAKYVLMFFVVLLSLSTISFAQQPAGAKIWFSPQKAITYNITKNYNLVLGTPDPVEPVVVAPAVITTTWAVDPPIKFCADMQAARIIQFRVLLTYDSQKLTIAAANFSTAVTGIALTATIIQPGEIEVEGITMMDAGSPVSADKSLFQINLPPQLIPAEPVTLQGTVDSLILMSEVSTFVAETASAEVKAIAKTSNTVVTCGDENNDGAININDLLYRSRLLSESMTLAGTVFPYNFGDFDLNGVVDIVDALNIARYPVGLIASITRYSSVAGDVDINGTINILDALLIARYSAGITANF